MNLNYAYDKQELVALASTADKKLADHFLVIDFDGEVILDPEKFYPGVPVSSYKFYTRIDDASLRHETGMASLYDELERIFNAINGNRYIGPNQHGFRAAA